MNTRSPRCAPSSHAATQRVRPIPGYPQPLGSYPQASQSARPKLTEAHSQNPFVSFGSAYSGAFRGAFEPAECVAAASAPREQTRGA
jgi:hypothetical protein